MDKESFFFNEDGVSVSNARFIAGGFKFSPQDPSRMGPMILILTVFGLMAMLGVRNAIVVGLRSIARAVALWFHQKPESSVLLSCASGNVSLRPAYRPNNQPTKATLFLALIIPILATTGCQDKRHGELTRELATEILNQHLATRSVSRLEFQKGGIYRAVQDGIIQKQGGYPPSYRFTDKGLKMVGAAIKQNDIVVLERFIEDSPFAFVLKTGIGQRVSEVSGIAEGPTPNIKVVEYVTNYLFPPEMQPMTLYIFRGSKEKSTFQKYDDGWRVVQ